MAAANRVGINLGCCALVRRVPRSRTRKILGGRVAFRGFETAHGVPEGELGSRRQFQNWKLAADGMTASGPSFRFLLQRTGSAVPRWRQGETLLARLDVMLDPHMAH